MSTDSVLRLSVLNEYGYWNTAQSDLTEELCVLVLLQIDTAGGVEEVELRVSASGQGVALFQVNVVTHRAVPPKGARFH